MWDAGVSIEAKTQRCHRMTHVIGAQSSTLSTALGHLPERIEALLENPIAKHNSMKVRTNLEGKTNRAAVVFGRVGLEGHVTVHLHHSTTCTSMIPPQYPHVNLNAGLGRFSLRTKRALPLNDPPDWSSIINPVNGAWSTTSEIPT